ncbi:MAG: 7-cyano-7-deazaguanine synthase [Bacteriovorax sp.]|jgi:7-cyano-7-deazaguanine synthase in queuosine biosynthesis
MSALNFDQQPICQKCVMPEVKPRITFNEEGICNLCVEHSKKPPVQPLLESDFIKILDKVRGKHRYDCLVMCSGGKDSTAALYFMKKRYNLNPLAFMFDHGFETEEAITNVKRAVAKLGVDFVFYKTNQMKEMFKSIVKTQSKTIICHPCSIWYMDLAFDMAEKHDAPIVIAGWTKGQSEKQEVMSKCGCNVHAPEYADMAKETNQFLEDFTKSTNRYKDFPRTMEELLAKNKKKKHKATVLSPHWFLPYGPEEYVKIIKEEVGWQYTKNSYPSKTTNCNMNFVSAYNAMKFFGYTHYHVEMSKLIREGVITREQAITDLKMQFSDELLNEVLSKIDCTVDDLRK